MISPISKKFEIIQITISWFTGEAVYPPEPAEGYGANKYVAKGKGYGPPPPKYAPA